VFFASTLVEAPWELRGPIQPLLEMAPLWTCGIEAQDFPALEKQVGSDLQEYRQRFAEVYCPYLPSRGVGSIRVSREWPM